MLVMGIFLRMVIPGEFPGLRVQGQRCVGVEIFAWTISVVYIRNGITYRNKNQSTFCIECQWCPDRATARLEDCRIRAPRFRSGLSGIGNSVEFPREFAVAQSEGAHPSFDPQFAACRCDDDKTVVN